MDFGSERVSFSNISGYKSDTSVGLLFWLHGEIAYIIIKPSRCKQKQESDGLKKKKKRLTPVDTVRTLAQNYV